MENASACFVDEQNNDFAILKNSAAAKAGIDLEKFNLPGWSEFKSKTPDAGAVPVGGKMFKVYRKPSEIKYTPAGFWPEPGAEITLPVNYAKGVLKNI